MRNPISAETRTRVLTMFALVFAGEMIYSLPFHLMRFFRPTVLEVFDFSNADLGDVFAPYGITAMLSYFPGGILADRFSARKMMCASLLFTAAGGFYLMTLPGFLGMSVLYAFWGVSSVFLFWCALIRTTRVWGGQLAQGRGFGLLDGGRGTARGPVRQRRRPLVQPPDRSRSDARRPGRTRGRSAVGHPVLHRLDSGGGRRGVVAHTRDAHSRPKTPAADLVQRPESPADTRGVAAGRHRDLRLLRLQGTRQLFPLLLRSAGDERNRRRRLRRHGGLPPSRRRHPRRNRG